MKMILKTASALIAMALAGTVDAAPIGVYNRYFVSGSTSAGAPGGGNNAIYGCNQEAYINTLSGCGVIGGGVGRFNNGTVDSTSYITSFFADSRKVSVVNNVLDPSIFSHASSAASLADASLHASVFNDTQNVAYVGGQAQADWHDILTFHVLGANSETRTKVHVQFTIDGNVLNNGQTDIYGNAATGDLAAFINLDNQSSANTNSDYALIARTGWTLYPGSTTALPSLTAGTVESRSFTNGQLAPWGSWTRTLQLMTFDGYFDLLGTDAVLNPTAGINLSCYQGLQCDYGSTAKFRFIDLPSNVTFTSASGVFLTGLGSPGAVPEPASWALMIAGFGLTGAAMRRRRGASSVLA
jgi:hypothetical protein